MLHSIFLDQPIDEALVSELVDGGWWKRDGDHFEVLAYTKHNPSAEELDDSAASARNRKAEYRSRSATLSHGTTQTLSHGTTNDNTNIVPRDNALRHREELDKTKTKTKTKTETRSTHTSRARENPDPTDAPIWAEPENFGVDSVANVFGEERTRAGGMPYTRQHSHYHSLEDAAEVFKECAKRLNIPPLEAARRSARNFCSEPWAREHKFPVGAWLKDPAKNLTESPQTEDLPWIARNVG